MKNHEIFKRVFKAISGSCSYGSVAEANLRPIRKGENGMEAETHV